jgi:hypothetical protein
LATIDPDLERQFVRKLDWHLPTLMAFFCMSRTAENRTH